jgi:hypothetical protein
MLEILGIDQPAEMTGTTILQHNWQILH